MAAAWEGCTEARQEASFDHIDASCSEFARGAAAYPRGHLLS
jgi:hypothetical protein